MNTGALIFLVLIIIIFIIQIRKYKKANPEIPPIPKKMEKVMKKSEDNPNGIIELAKKVKEAFSGKSMIEAFTDIKDIRYGKIGCNNCPNGESINQWIKLARVTVNGAWNAKGFTLEIYPRIRWTGSSRQTIVCLIRNADKDLETPYVSLTTHNEAHDNTRTLKDIRIVRVSGTGVNNNIVEVWGQMGTGWADINYAMFYLYAIDTKDEIVIDRSPMQANPPGGQNWGVTDRNEPNGIFTKDITMAIDPNDKNIKGIGMRRTDEAGRYHEWKQWHMNDMYGRNDYQLYEYATDSKGNACGGNWNDGARCLSRLTIKGGSGNVGINTTNPRGTLEVAGDIRLGRWSLRDENGALVFRDMIAQAAGRDRRIAMFPEQNVDLHQDRSNWQYGEVYLNLNCGGGPQVRRQYIKFRTPFLTAPRIYTSLGLIDWCNNGRNLRVNTYPEGITTEGFTLVLTTWADTSFYGATIRWLAFYNY